MLCLLCVCVRARVVIRTLLAQQFYTVIHVYAFSPSFTYQSTSAISTLDDPSYVSASFSHAGAIALQCPHQGAKNCV